VPRPDAGAEPNVRMGSASIGSSSSSSGNFRIFRIFLILLRCSSSASACISCFTSSLTIDRDLMLLTRSGCPREVATGRVHSDLTRAAVDVGFHLARPEEFIKTCLAASSMCRARCGLITSRSSEPRQWGAHFASPSKITRWDRCTTEVLELQDFQISDA
jgi:hypothetical protein